MTEEFKHGVLYPIGQAPKGVPLMLWRGSKNEPYSFPRVHGKFGWLSDGGMSVHITVDVTHFTLWPELPKPVNSRGKYIDEDGNFREAGVSGAGPIILRKGMMQHNREQSLALARWILNYHGEDA